MSEQPQRSERSLRDRLAQIADMIDLEQLDGLVIRRDSVPMNPEEEQPRLHRLFMGLEQDNNQNNQHQPNPPPPLNNEVVRQEQEVDVVFAPFAPDFWSIMGANRTALNRAIKEGKYELAEKLITSQSNPENLNDGSMTHALSTGKGLYRARPRNLRIVRLLLEKGASPNFRSPNVLDLPSVSAFEVAINYYLTLLKYQDSTNQTFRFDESDLLNTVGLSGEDWLDLNALIIQAKDLVKLFIEHGADVNLQTTNAGRTIFHEVIANEISDHELIERMVTLGALVNLTDVHGTTPFMDLIKNTDVAVKVYRDLNHHQKRVLIDAENCCNETSLWRSMFHGRLDCSEMLINEGANTALAARIQESPADSFIGSYGFRPFGFNAQLLKKRTVIKTLPALFAPLLFDSPCITAERDQTTGDQNETMKVCMLDKFSVKLFNRVVDKYLSPLVDSCDPGFSREEMSQIMVNLIKNHTDYKHLIDDKIFQPQSLVQLMFGKLSSGLRQLAVRKLLISALFQKPLEELASTLDRLKGAIVVPMQQSQSPNKKLKSKSYHHPVKEWQDIEVPNNTTCGSDSALTISSLSDVQLPVKIQESSGGSNNVTLSEPELRSSTPIQDGIHRFGENWYLRESPQYNHQQGGGGNGSSSGNNGRRRVFNSLEGYELEISQDSGRQTVSRLHRMLQETDDRLERLQSEVHQVSRTGESEPSEEGVANSSSSSIPELERNLPDCRYNSDEEPPLTLWRPKTSDDSDDDENTWAITEPTSDGRFKVLPFEFSPRGKITPKLRIKGRPDPRFDDSTVRLLSPKVINRLGQELGIPPGLKPYLELEAARLQLGAALFHHATIKCDRGCEGNDDDSDITSEDDDDESWDNESLSQPTSGHDESSSEAETDPNSDVEISQLFVPSVPERPRILSTSSSSSSSSSSIPELGPSHLDDLPRVRISVVQANAAEVVMPEREHEQSLWPAAGQQNADEENVAGDDSDDPRDFFSFGASNEHHTIMRYVQQFVTGTFDHSTDSETDDDDDDRFSEKMPPLE